MQQNMFYFHEKEIPELLLLEKERKSDESRFPANMLPNNANLIHKILKKKYRLIFMINVYLAFDSYYLACHQGGGA